MNVVIRADASIYIGSGHIMRCLVLAKQLQQLNYQVIFATRPQQGDFVEHIKKQGFKVIELIQPKVFQKPQHSADYHAWLQVPWQVDADDLLDKVQAFEFDKNDLVIVDHYALNIEWEQYVAKELNCKIVAIDDVLRKHHCDMLLDQTLGRSPSDYSKLTPKYCDIMTGLEYALLNEKFSKYRQLALNKPKNATSSQNVNQNNSYKPHSLLIMMGGIDNTNITLFTLQAVEKYGFEKFAQITVIINPKSPFYKSVKQYLVNQPRHIIQLDFVDNIAELMCEHSIAIGAPGSTSWERVCLGMPSIIVPLAENQEMICTQLAKAKVAIAVAFDQLQTKLCEALTALVSNFEQYRENCLSLCDGFGVYRVAAKVDILLQADSYLNGCRLATNKDIDLVFKWQSLPETRRYALNKNIPTYQEHCSWMQAKLASSDDFFYIIEKKAAANNKTSVGVLRLDYGGNNTYTLSIFIDPEYFGLGLASQTLSYIDRVHPQITINATVLVENTASQKLFTKAGYKHLTAEHYQRLPLSLRQIHE